MKRLLLATALAAKAFSYDFGFDGAPWVIEPLKPELSALYSYAFYSKVHGYASHFVNNQLFVELDVAFPNHFQLGVALDQDASTFRDFYFRAALVELKKQFLDDVAEGDAVSVAAGVRGIAQTPQGRLDPATLYPGGYHFQIYLSLGKEWAFDPENYVRFWLFGGLGIASHASLWAELDGSIVYRAKHHELKVFGVSNISYGAQTWVDINHFEGWGHTRYRYLDLGFTYGYEIAQDLMLKAGFTKRALSKVMPRNYNYFEVMLEKVF